MSRTLPALQENALAAADAFCRRYISPPRRKRQKTVLQSQPARPDTQHPKPRRRQEASPFYRPRDHETSPFFKVVRERFDEFEKVYPQRYQERYGYWRPVIRSLIEKFIKCGDLKEGFARVRCPDCKEEIFVAFSCRQRACCQSYARKRSLLLAHRLMGEAMHRACRGQAAPVSETESYYDRDFLGQ